MTELKTQIAAALAGVESAPLKDAALALLETLGYRSERTLDLGGEPQAFLEQFDNRPDRPFRQDKALFDEWRQVHLLFQLTDDEIRAASAQGELAFDSSTDYDGKNYRSYLFLALELKKGNYTRTRLSDITREINRLFDMPVLVFFKVAQASSLQSGASQVAQASSLQSGTSASRDACATSALTLAVIDRRISKKDGSKDVLEKVKLIKDIRCNAPHRAHLEILHDLSLMSLMAHHECRNFAQLHEAWRKTLDTNMLNRKFYRELADWYFWALEHVEFPDDVEKDPATRNATNVIRLLTRLIFCWFLKEKGLIPDDLFSERKLGGILKSLKSDDSTFYKAVLQNLFFGTLNQRMNSGAQQPRKFAVDGKSITENKDQYGVKNLYRYQKLFAVDEETALKLFEDVPFLNGGLFDCLDKEDQGGKVIYVDGFTRNQRKQPKVPNFLFFSEPRTLDLSNAFGDKKRKKEQVRGLIHLLDSYKFTVTENTPIEEEIALDPELLGKVFENLLASYNPETGTTARKQTGSFYTPREIVNYMVDESLKAYLERKLSQVAQASSLQSGTSPVAQASSLQSGASASKDACATTARLDRLFAYTEEPHQFTDNEVDTLISAIDTCKILDPACGSGAFPMGILHKLVFILGKLDPRNERWKRKQIEKAEQIPDVSARETAINAIEKDFETNDLDYGRKLYLIENCIYGVDIQPVAIQISKLRFFISLVCDQRTNKNKAQNCGVRPLPNLETKFVAANTLIALESGQDQFELEDQRLKPLQRQLTAVRHKHFAAQRRSDKLTLQKKDSELREQIAAVLADGGMSSSASKQLAAWDPYDQNAHAEFFDPQWMYGITDGFDVVIGNPPYVQIQKLPQAVKLTLAEQKFVTFSKTADLYCLFYERGGMLLSTGGTLCYISSNKFFRSGYGQSLRQLMTQKYVLHRLIDFGELPVFEAGTDPVIVQFGHNGKPTLLAATIKQAADILQLSETINATGFTLEPASLPESGWSLGGVASSGILEKMRATGTPLGEYVNGEIYYGIKTGFNEAFVLTTDQRNALIAADPKSAEIIKPLAKGDDVRKWHVRDKGRWIILTKIGVDIKRYPAVFAHLKKWEPQLRKRQDQGDHWWELRACAYYDAFEKPKIMYPVIAKELRYTLDKAKYLSNDKTYLIPAKNRAWLLGLLNAPTTWFFLRSICSGFGDAAKGGRLEFRAIHMSCLPIPSATPSQQKQIEALVDRILAAKKADPAADVSELEAEIDRLVYKLYDLTPDEIAIVEGEAR